jgi:hypothetical protein
MHGTIDGRAGKSIRSLPVSLTSFVIPVARRSLLIA